jgi:uncharacterized protein YecE (DUF72 family)
MASTTHAIRIGTCGWSYKDWVGLFYPTGLSPADYLPYYAQRFSIVEVDSTFYRSPTKKMVQGWRDKTPNGFSFSLKVPQTITHEKVLVDCAGEVEEFVSAARLLGDKLLCCVLQFAFFNRAVLPSLDSFLQRLAAFLECWPKDVQLAVEIRNKGWIGEEFASFLRQHRAVWVLSDQAWMPSPLALAENFDVATGPFAYIRLLGDRQLVDSRTKTLDHVVVDRSAEIASDAKAIRSLSVRVPVVTFVNNHFAGYAHDTIRDLQEALNGSGSLTRAVDDDAPPNVPPGRFF